MKLTCDCQTGWFMLIRLPCRNVSRSCLNIHAGTLVCGVVQLIVQLPLPPPISCFRKSTVLLTEPCLNKGGHVCAGGVDAQFINITRCTLEPLAVRPSDSAVTLTFRRKGCAVNTEDVALFVGKWDVKEALQEGVIVHVDLCVCVCVWALLTEAFLNYISVSLSVLGGVQHYVMVPSWKI